MPLLDLSRARPIRHWRVPLWSMLALIVLAPAVAMRFTGEVKWDAADFLMAAVLMGTIGIACEVAARLPAQAPIRALIVLGSTLLVLTIWADAAVGLLD